MYLESSLSSPNPDRQHSSTQLDKLWADLRHALQQELPQQQYATWIRPLLRGDSREQLTLLAPNRFFRDWVVEKYLGRINEILMAQSQPVRAVVSVQGAASEQTAVTSQASADKDLEAEPTQRLQSEPNFPAQTASAPATQTAPWNGATKATPANALADTSQAAGIGSVKVEGSLKHDHALISSLNFSSFVEGKSNQLARAAARQVAENPGGAYNPLFIYGGTGLGKTHLMHSIGNSLLQQNPNAKIIYLHSERFVADMVKALQLNAINDFKRYYRSVDALLIDDIQFFSHKDRSQEEFFHTFNALLEGGHQMILSCDCYPKEINGLEERLKSRFGWGLTVAIEPPELETRAAILMKKAEQSTVDLPQDVALFIAQRVKSNVRDLEGALKRVIATAHFQGGPIDEALVRESLKDLFALQDRQVSLDNIQRTVAEYYKIKFADLMAKRRSRSIARPRQLAMALAKELTNLSFPEIGKGFGGRDHTTVLHACKKINELRESDTDVSEDYKNLLRMLTT